LKEFKKSLVKSRRNSSVLLSFSSYLNGSLRYYCTIRDSIMNEAFNASQANLSMYYNSSNSNNESLGTSNGSNGNASNSGNSPRTLTIEGGVRNDGVGGGVGAGAGTSASTVVNPNSVNNANIVNDIYSQLSQLTNQFNNYQNATNEKNHQLNIRLNFINDTVESMKRNMSDVNQQMLLLLQDNRNNNFSTYYNSQNKVLEVFSKHISKLSKDIEELSNAPNPMQNQVGGLPSHPQLQSQQHLTQPVRIIPRTNSTSNCNEDDGFGKTLTIRSPALQGNSNPTSPFIPNKFNFDINTFPVARTNPTSFAPTPPTFQVHSNTPHQNFATMPYTVIPTTIASKVPNNTDSNHPSIPLTSSETEKSHSKSKKRRKSSKPRQPSNSAPSYMLPLPTLLPKDEEGLKNGTNNIVAHTGSLKGGHSPLNQVQFMATLTRPGETNPIINTALRQAQVQESQFFSDIDHTMVPITTRPREDSDISTNTGNSESKSKDSDLKSISTKSDKSESNKDPTQFYRVERSLKTITDIWKEYKYGLKDKPPLKLLEHKYGTKWRNETESRTFLRRKKIYDAIEVGMREGIEESAIIQELEEYRSYDNNGTIKKKPLLWLSTHIPEKYVR
jgi:hypothetical protein